MHCSWLENYPVPEHGLSWTLPPKGLRSWIGMKVLCILRNMSNMLQPVIFYNLLTLSSRSWTEIGDEIKLAMWLRQAQSAPVDFRST